MTLSPRLSCVVHWITLDANANWFSTNDHWLRAGLMDKQWPADILQWPMIELDLSRRRVDKKLPIYIGSFFPSPLLLDLMSVPTKWNKVCCHSERSGRYLNTSLTHIDGWCHDGCQTSTNMDSIFSDYWGLLPAHGPLPYALQIQFRTRGYSKNILSRWHTSVVATFAFLSGNSRPNILLRSSGWPSHEIVILSAISTYNIPAINIVVLGIIFILHIWAPSSPCDFLVCLVFWIAISTSHISTGMCESCVTPIFSMVQFT